MATLMFVCLKAGKVIETPYDWPIFCALLALELPQYIRIALYWRSK